MLTALSLRSLVAHMLLRVDAGDIIVVRVQLTNQSCGSVGGTGMGPHVELQDSDETSSCVDA